ncbi:hypothetical protein BXY82_2821 [Gelidibacter sediminis]|uniref:Uncharacterized protein n=1 Tax=Gelidibacter sediminis TaxID=1608710 RepID=A0A4V6Q4G2_9FLAO|nr:hypothetical protein [Gelidibacter sediminis]TDU34496.1 hypothetical protein BXY82_2821 [Gelidibacter sediminis]
MKIKLTKIYTILFGVSLLFGTFLSCQTEPLDAEQDLSLDSNVLANKSKVATFKWPACENELSSEVNLYAGQNILVGTVIVEVIGANYEITYKLTNSGYCLAATHLSVVNDKLDFPMNNGGNPVIGHFEYSENHDCISSYTYTVPTSKGTYIAAHAVVHCVSDVTSDAFAMALPDQVNVCVAAKGVPNNYYDINIASGTSLSGSYGAWCLDQDARLDNLDCFTGDVYSSYEALPEDKFENPENFGAVNWLMNQGFIGQDSQGLGDYTFGDIQIAIWKLVDDSVCVDCEFTGPFNNDRVDILVAMALEHTDFIPSCGDDVIIILVPTDDKQSIFISIPAPCGNCEETAFGAGCGFPGANWFTWFQYGNVD